MEINYQIKNEIRRPTKGRWRSETWRYAKQAYYRGGGGTKEVFGPCL